MPLQASRTIGTGDGWQRTDSGILLPDWADLPDTTPDRGGRAPAAPADRDRPVRRRGRLLVRVQAGRLARDRRQRMGRRRRPHLPHKPRRPAHPDRVLHPRRPGPLGPPPQAARALPRPARPAAARARLRLDRHPARRQAVRGVLLRRRPRPHRRADPRRARPHGDDIGCVFGGPPCQGFSRAGKRQADDPRNELVFEFMRIVCEIHPRSFCMENVPGMLDMVTRDGVPVIDALALMAQEGGMGTFDAIRRSLAETAGAGAALRTMTAGSTRRQPQPGVSANGHIDLEDDQLQLFAGN